MLNRPWRKFEADHDEQFESSESSLIILYSTNQPQYREKNEILIQLLQKHEIYFDDQSNSCSTIDEPHFFDSTGLPVLIINKSMVLSFDEAVNLLNVQPAYGMLLYKGLDFNYLEHQSQQMIDKQRQEWLNKLTPFVEVSEDIRPEEEADID